MPVASRTMGPSISRSAATVLVVLIALAAVLVAPADAGSAHRAVPRRDLNEKVIQKGQHRLFFVGRVDPGPGPVFVERKLCRKGCPWERTDKTTTNDNGQWRVEIYAPRHGYWYYRAYVNPFHGYARSYSAVWRTFTAN